jgi:hypothetical protein
MIDEKDIEIIYKEAIKAIADESIEELHDQPHKKRFNRDTYFKLKI